MRQFIDLYTYRLKYTKINEKYVELILKQFGFLEFYNNVMETINYWFAGGIENEITKIITQKVLTSCLFGTSKSKEMLVISRDIKRSGNAKKSKDKSSFVYNFSFRIGCDFALPNFEKSIMDIAHRVDNKMDRCNF